jgi:hypothetical protein
MRQRPAPFHPLAYVISTRYIAFTVSKRTRASAQGYRLALTRLVPGHDHFALLPKELARARCFSIHSAHALGSFVSVGPRMRLNLRIESAHAFA